MGCVRAAAPRHPRVASCELRPASHAGAGGLGAVLVLGAWDGGGAASPCDAPQCVVYTGEVAAGR